MERQLEEIEYRENKRNWLRAERLLGIIGEGGLTLMQVKTPGPPGLAR